MKFATVIRVFALGAILPCTAIAAANAGDAAKGAATGAAVGAVTGMGAGKGAAAGAVIGGTKDGESSAGKGAATGAWCPCHSRKETVMKIQKAGSDNQEVLLALMRESFAPT